MKITVVIPAFNEEKRLGSVLTDLKKHKIKEIIVVDDGSDDNTILVAQKEKVTIIPHPVNLGQGAAIQTGLEYAKRIGSEITVTFDADGQFVASEVPRMIKPILQKKVDIVLGSRFLGKAVNIPLTRKFILKLGIIFTWLFSGIKLTDTHNGFRAFSRKALSLINIKQNGMAHASEIIHQIKRYRLKYCEIPVTVKYSRGHGPKSENIINILADLITRELLFPK